jgi:RNA polymerase sigma-70 factor, ECF subfamily
MLGSVSEAEDVVQDAWLRARQGEQADIRSARAYLTTIVTRLCIDHLRSAERTRMEYPGPWLPEPLAEPNQEDAELASSLATAFLVLLEQLSATERAVFLLREVFEFDFDEIARIVGKSEANTRQLAARARRHVEDGRPRFDASREQREELAARFLEAFQDGNLEALEELLAEDVELHGDGGGKAPALARPLFGRSRVARTLSAWAKSVARIGGLTMRHVDVNGQPGAMTFDGEGNVINVIAFDVVDGRIQALRSIVNPDKLDHLGQVGDAQELLRALRSRQRSA